MLRDFGVDDFAPARFDAQLLGLQSVAAPIDRKILTFAEAEPAQFVEKRDIMRGVRCTQGQATEAIGPPRFLREHG